MRSHYLAAAPHDPLTIPSLKRHVKLSLLLAAVLLLAACATTPDPAPVSLRTAPLVDYHQHLVSPTFAPIVKLPARDGAALVKELDEAGIERAVVLSVGYSFADERKGLPDPDRQTREQNDWTSAEVVRNAPRLIGFGSANPLRPAALEELERCLRLPGMVGIKLHLGNGGISLRNPDHLARIQQVFALAQRLRAPVLVHMRARGGTNYGAEDAHIFLDKVVSVAPDIEIVVAHLGASSPGYPPQNDEVMAVFGRPGEGPRVIGELRPRSRLGRHRDRVPARQAHDRHTSRKRASSTVGLTWVRPRGANAESVEVYSTNSTGVPFSTMWAISLASQFVSRTQPWE